MGYPLTRGQIKNELVRTFRIAKLNIKIERSQILEISNSILHIMDLTKLKLLDNKPHFQLPKFQTRRTKSACPDLQNRLAGPWSWRNVSRRIRSWPCDAFICASTTCASASVSSPGKGHTGNCSKADSSGRNRHTGWPKFGRGTRRPLSSTYSAHGHALCPWLGATSSASARSKSSDCGK